MPTTSIVPTKLIPIAGSKLVSISGSAEPLSDVSINIRMLYVRAKTTNTNNIYFGTSTVNKLTAPQIILTAGQDVSIDLAQSDYCIDPSNFYIDSEIAGEGVDFLYV